jgi:hypothetical protein
MNNWSGILSIAGVAVVGGVIYHTVNKLVHKIEKMLMIKMKERHILLKINSSDKDIVGHLINCTTKPVKNIPLILPDEIIVPANGTTRVNLKIGYIIPENIGFFIMASENIEPLIINKSANIMIYSPGEYSDIVITLKNSSNVIKKLPIGTVGFYLYAGDFGMFNVQITN